MANKLQSMYEEGKQNLRSFSRNLTVIEALKRGEKLSYLSKLLPVETAMGEKKKPTHLKKQDHFAICLLDPESETFLLLIFH